jgi:hypothetical protein
MFTRVVIGFVALVSFGTAAPAQSFFKDRLSDWEFRFYACKNVVMNAVIVIRLMGKYKVTSQSGIDELQSQIGPAVANAVSENEKEYRFVEGESSFVSDLTFAVVSGMVHGGYELSATQLIQSGNDLCIQTIEAMAQ